MLSSGIALAWGFFTADSNRIVRSPAVAYMASRLAPSSHSVVSGNHVIRPRRVAPQASLAINTAGTRQVPLVATPTVGVKHVTAECSRSPPLASVWREIQGCDDWEDLVEPLNPLLREEVVRYGEFVIACYKAFDLDPSSKRHLNCKYGKRSMLRDVGMVDAGYEITKYIYATPDIDIPMQESASSSRWIGYVAVSSDDMVRKLGRRDIVVAFRGTVTGAEWVANLMSSLSSARFDPRDPRPDVKVESGFLNLYTSDGSTTRFNSGSCREQLLSEVTRIINEHKDEDLSITLAGHSMGSSLALLCGYDLAELGLNRDGSNQEVPITVYSFGGPRVGNSAFKERCEELGVKVLRVVNVKDPVTKVPGVFMNEKFRALSDRYELQWGCSCYTHVGVELALDFFKMNNPGCVHDMDAYIGLLKCPKLSQMQKTGAGLLNKTWQFLNDRSFDSWTWQWQDAAMSLTTLLQSIII